MSGSENQQFWESLNKMLSENLKFTEPAQVDKRSVFKFTFNEADSLRAGIEYALKNTKQIASLEHEFNDGQPVTSTEKHLQWAKVFIDNSEVHSETLMSSSVLNAHSEISLGQFLLECHALALRNPQQFRIQTDYKREQLIKTLFGETYNEVVLEPSTSELKPNTQNISCTQIIFDSADVASALDELIINLSDRTDAPWRIQSVYVQESLKNVVYDTLAAERLNAACSNGSGIISLSDAEKQHNEDLAKRYGGRLLESNNKVIRLLFDVPPKHVRSATEQSARAVPVAVNFFRTTKELIQLVKGDLDAKKKHLTSVWTENIGLLYEVAADISAEIIWNNSIGIFDENMPSLIDEFDNERVKRSISSMNSRGKYAVHGFQGADKTQKYLYIPYGKTFAN